MSERPWRVLRFFRIERWRVLAYVRVYHGYGLPAFELVFHFGCPREQERESDT